MSTTLHLRMFIVSGCLAVSLASGALPPVGKQLERLELQDGRVLTNLVVLNYSSQTLTARWDGGRGTINYRVLPEPLRAEAEEQAAVDTRQRESRNQERKADLREQRLSGPAGPSAHASPQTSTHHAVQTEAGHIELDGEAFVSGGNTMDDTVRFAGMQVVAYPLREALWATETNLTTIDWPAPLASTSTDSAGRWTLKVPAGTPYMLYAKGEHFATRTGNLTTWTWKVSSHMIGSNTRVQLTDLNAEKTWRVYLNDPSRRGYHDHYWNRVPVRR